MSHKVFDFTLDTSVPPERVLAAATDFTSERLRLWPTISSKRYKVHELRDSWCDCTEGTGPFWERNHWDWSEPGVVRAVVKESNVHVPPGAEEMRVTPREGGGSHIEVHMERTFKGPLGLMLQWMLALTGRSKFFRRSFQRTIDILEAEHAKQPADATRSSRSRKTPDGDS